MSPFLSVFHRMKNLPKHVLVGVLFVLAIAWLGNEVGAQSSGEETSFDFSSSRIGYWPLDTASQGTTPDLTPNQFIGILKNFKNPPLGVGDVNKL